MSNHILIISHPNTAEAPFQPIHNCKLSLMEELFLQQRNYSLNLLSAYCEFPSNDRNSYCTWKITDGTITMRIVMLSTTMTDLLLYTSLPINFGGLGTVLKVQLQNSWNKIYPCICDATTKREEKKIHIMDQKEKNLHKETGNALYCWGLLWS